MAIDQVKLKDLLEKDATLEELKKKLGVKNKLSIQAAVGRLMASEGKVYNVSGLFSSPGGGGGRGMASVVTNGKQGLRLSSTRMGNLGYKGDERFEPVKVGNGILLKEV